MSVSLPIYYKELSPAVTEASKPKIYRVNMVSKVKGEGRQVAVVQGRVAVQVRGLSGWRILMGGRVGLLISLPVMEDNHSNILVNCI